MYNAMSLTVEQMRACQCDTPLAMTKPKAVANKGRMYACTSWCPFCGVTQHVTADAKMFPNTAPADVWRLDADKIYEFVSRINDLGYLPKHAGSDDLAWTFPQSYSDGTFSTNVFNIAVAWRVGIDGFQLSNGLATDLHHLADLMLRETKQAPCAAIFVRSWHGQAPSETSGQGFRAGRIHPAVWYRKP